MSKLFTGILFVSLSIFFLRAKWKYTDNEHVEVVQIISKSTHPHRSNCTLTSCIDLSKCISEYRGIGVYVAPLLRIVDEFQQNVTNIPTRQFLYLRKFIKDSEFYEPDENKACFVVPGIDLLNQNAFSHEVLEDVYSTIKHRYSGSNLLIFSLAGRSLPLDIAVLATAQPVSWKFRSGFDLSIPFVYSELTRKIDTQIEEKRRGIELLVSTSGVNDVDLRKLVDHLGVAGVEYSEKTVLGKTTAENDVLEEMKNSKWCLVHERQPAFEMILWKAMSAGCLPIIYAPPYELPFSEVVQWNRFSLNVFSVGAIPQALKSVDEKRLFSMRSHQKFIFDRYMSCWSTVILTSLRQLEERILPNRVRTLAEWNGNNFSFTLSRLSPSSEFTLVTEYSQRYSVETSRLLLWAGQNQNIHKAIILRKESDRIVGDDLTNLSYPIDFVSDVDNFANFELFLRNKVDTEAVVFVPTGFLPPRTSIDVLMAIWRENPSELLLHVYGSDCREIFIFHKTSSSSCPHCSFLDSIRSLTSRKLITVSKAYSDCFPGEPKTVL